MFLYLCPYLVSVSSVRICVRHSLHVRDSLDHLYLYPHVSDALSRLCLIQLCPLRTPLVAWYCCISLVNLVSTHVLPGCRAHLLLLILPLLVVFVCFFWIFPCFSVFFLGVYSPLHNRTRARFHSVMHHVVLRMDHARRHQHHRWVTSPHPMLNLHVPAPCVHPHVRLGSRVPDDQDPPAHHHANV